MAVLTMSALLLFGMLFPPTAGPQRPAADPAFTISVPPVRPAMVQGGSTEFIVIVQSREPADFRLRIEGVPASVVADPVRIAPGRSTIVLRCASDTPIGTYALQVTASAGMNQQTQTFALDIKPARSQK
jgi:hypothetical protein